MGIFNFWKDEPIRDEATKEMTKYYTGNSYPVFELNPTVKEVSEINRLVRSANHLNNDGYVKSAISTYEIASARLNEYITELKGSLNETP